MASDPSQPSTRSAALRALLVERVRSSDAELSSPRTLGYRSGRSATDPSRIRTFVATAVVVSAVVIASVAALNAHPIGGTSPAGGVTQSPVTSPSVSLPAATPTPGQVLAVLSNTTGSAKQVVTVAPEGLSLNVAYRCSGGGTLSITIPHVSDQRSHCTGRNAGSGVGNKGTPGRVPVTVSATGKHIAWTVTISVVPETYVTPQPVLAPTNGSGAAVSFCATDVLTTKYRAVRPPSEVTETEDGEIVFTNTGSVECALAGYPVLQFVGSDGQLIGRHSNDQTDQRDSLKAGLRPVLVAPGGTAYLQFSYDNPTYFAKNHLQKTCTAVRSSAIRVDLANSLAGPAQQGTLTVATTGLLACTQRTALQLFNTVFVDYAAEPGK